MIRAAVMLHTIARKAAVVDFDVAGFSARVEAVWAEWRRLNDEAQTLHDDLYAELDPAVVRAGIPQLRAYEEAINSVIAKGEALLSEHEAALAKTEADRDEAAAQFEAAVDALVEVEDRITDVTSYGIEPDIDGAIEDWEAWLADPEENTKSAPSAGRRRKGFMDGLTPDIEQAVLAADGGEDLWRRYEALAFEMDALDEEIVTVTAEIEQAQQAAADEVSRAEAEAGAPLDPAATAALYAEADQLIDQKDNLLAAREELLAEAARLESEMLVAIS